MNQQSLCPTLHGLLCLSTPSNPKVHPQTLVTIATAVVQALQRTLVLRGSTCCSDHQTSWPPAFPHHYPHLPHLLLPHRPHGIRSPSSRRPGAQETTWRLFPSWCLMVRSLPWPRHYLTTPMMKILMMMMMMGGTGFPTTMPSLPVPPYLCPPASPFHPLPPQRAFPCSLVPHIQMFFLLGMKTTTWRT